MTQARRLADRFRATSLNLIFVTADGSHSSLQPLYEQFLAPTKKEGLPTQNVVLIHDTARLWWQFLGTERPSGWCMSFIRRLPAVISNYWSAVDADVKKNLETFSTSTEKNAYRGGVILFDKTGDVIWEHVEKDLSGDPADLDDLNENVKKLPF